MVKPIANEKYEAILDSLLLSLPDVVAGEMFGCPAYYINRKLFACVYGDGVGVKLQEELAKDLPSKDHIVPFQPMGRVRMKEWIYISRSNSSDYGKGREIFRAAAKYVGSLNGK